MHVCTQEPSFKVEMQNFFYKKSHLKNGYDLKYIFKRISESQIACIKKYNEKIEKYNFLIERLSNIHITSNLDSAKIVEKLKGKRQGILCAGKDLVFLCKEINDVANGIFYFLCEKEELNSDQIAIMSVRLQSLQNSIIKVVNNQKEQTEYYLSEYEDSLNRIDAEYSYGLEESEIFCLDRRRIEEIKTYDKIAGWNLDNAMMAYRKIHSVLKELMA